MVKVFITGATGYIGGDALYALYEAHPDWEYAALLRNEEKAKPVLEQYPKIKPVYGTLDSYDVIKNAAAEADMVVHTADSSDNVAAARAIRDGLIAGHSKSNPGYWLHISGTAILCWYDIRENRYGEPPLPEQFYDDMDGVSRLLSLPDDAIHRNVDSIVLGATADHADAVRAVVVAPPCIYGAGRGSVNRHSKQLPWLANATLLDGAAPVVGAGKTEWPFLHISDVSSLLVALADKAVALGGGDNDPAVFGPQTYFLAADRPRTWKNVAEKVAETAAKKGLIPEAKIKAIPGGKQAVETLGPFQAISWGANSVGKALRAKHYLGWEPKGPQLEDTLADAVDVEAKALGMTLK